MRTAHTSNVSDTGVSTSTKKEHPMSEHYICRCEPQEMTPAAPPQPPIITPDNLTVGQAIGIAAVAVVATAIITAIAKD
jgi:hypothetical protein